MAYALMVILSLLSAVCKGYLVLIQKSKEVKTGDEDIF